MNDCNGKVVLVTGGSRGIGAATAALAARHGYCVAVNYVRDAEAAMEVVEHVRSKGQEAIGVQADVSSEADVVRMFEDVEAKLGSIAALVNNAGILAPLSRVEDMNCDRMRRIFEVNVIGSFLCAREAVRRMSTSRGGNGGAIVNVSSGAARLGGANQYIDYASSKGAIDTFTIGLAKEVASEGIRVNGVRPGFVKTEMHDSVTFEDRMKSILPTIPLNRTGTVDEIANAIVWLLSERASYCTGTILDVTGGR